MNGFEARSTLQQSPDHPCTWTSSAGYPRKPVKTTYFCAIFVGPMSTGLAQIPAEVKQTRTGNRWASEGIVIELTGAVVVGTGDWRVAADTTYK